jgi:ubiquinone/menaquinone biosynthesis C-methylase UbiE
MTMPTPVSGFFEGERLELTWRYAYRSEFIPLLLDYLGAQPGTRILDVGCGSGFLARLLARNLDNVQVVGLDADEKMLGLARQMLEREDLVTKVELRDGDAFRIPFPDDAFDLVTSQSML